MYSSKNYYYCEIKRETDQKKRQNWCLNYLEVLSLFKILKYFLMHIVYKYFFSIITNNGSILKLNLSHIASHKSNNLLFLNI